MATKLEELFIELSAKNDKLIKGLNEAVDKVKKSGDKIKKETERTGKSAEASILKIPKAAELMAGVLGGGLVLGAIAKLTRFMGEAFTGVRDLSRGLAEINTLLPKNARLTEANAKQFIKFSSLYDQDIRSETKAFYDIVSAGISDTTKAMEVLEVANEAAVGGLTEVATAADVITSSMNAYSKSGLSARDISDSLFKAVKEGKTTFGELASSLGRVAPLAAAAGLKFGELTGIIAALTKGGLSTAEATTGVRAILTGIIKPAQEAATFAKQLGLEFNTTALRAKGLTGFMADLAEKTGGSETALAKLFPSVQALGPILQIVRGDLQAFNKTIEETSNTANDTERAAKIIRENFDFKFGQAGRNVKNLGISFLNFFKPLAEFNLDRMNLLFAILPVIGKKFTSSFGGSSVATVKELQDEIGKLEHRINNLGDLAPIGIREGLENELSKTKIELRGIEFPKGIVGDIVKEIEDSILGRGPIEIPFQPKIGDVGGGEGDPIVVPLKIQAEAAKTSIKEFTVLEKEAAKAGQELADSLLDSGEQLKTRADLLKVNRDKELLDEKASNEEKLKGSEEFFDAQKEMLISNFESELDQLEEANEQKLLSKENFLAAEKELELQQTVALIESDTQRAKTRKAIKDKADKEDIKDREAFLSTAATLARTENSVLNAIGKAAAVTQIAIATPPAIASSFKFGSTIGGPILGGVFAGIAGAAMAAQAASIAGIGLATGLTEVPSGFPNDTFRANLSSKDLVETMAMMRQFIMSNQGSKQNISFHIQTLIGDDEIAKRQLTGMLNDFITENGGALRVS